ncbi:MAG: OmpH family outer membrane protein [Flavobacteriaceae bacterium]|jgi:Skp family chaperone for outer membrane proteins|nr:OmpH family outer membrane protein [Flavobacteriaceae bacterium]
MRFFWTLLVCFFITGFTSAQRNVRIGFLDIDKVLAAHSGFSESSQDLKTKIISWRNEIDTRQKELDEQKKALEIERPLLTQEIVEEREDDIAFEQDKLNQYVEQRFGVEGDWIKQKLLLAQPAQDEILTAIREIAADRKLNYVFDSTAEILVLHSEKKYDISDLVIRYLEIEDKKKAQAFLAETKKEERKQRSNPSTDERRKKIEQQKAERLKLLEERKAELERRKQEREAEVAQKKKETEEALAKRKKERLEELERRKKEFEEKRKQAQQKK